MLSSILSWISGGLIGQIAAPLERAYQAKLAAQTDADRLDAEKQIEFFKEQMALAVAAAHEDKWYSPRSIMAYVAFLYYAKIAAWDTVLGWGTTPDPGPYVNGITLTIISFYFGSKAIGDVAAKLLGAAVRR